MKVRFEIEIENKEILERMPRNDEDMFKGAEGKNFLAKDPLTGALSIHACNKGIDETHKYADVFFMPLPVNTKIIDGDETDEDTQVSDLKHHFDERISTLSEDIHEILGKCIETIEEKQVVITQGVDENTLLEALRIVSGVKK